MVSPGFWGFGVLGFWGFGVLGFWGFGVLGFWGFGVLGFWGFGGGGIDMDEGEEGWVDATKTGGLLYTHAPHH